MCMERLTLQTLRRPPRIVTDYLYGLKISCDYAERGCRGRVELGILENHLAHCNYFPVVCSNDNCTAIVNKQEKEHHETKVCQFRIVQCCDCNEHMSYERYRKHGCFLSKEVNNMKLDLQEMKDQFGKMRSTQEEIRKAITTVITDIEMMKNTTRLDSGREIVVSGGYNNTNRSLLNSTEMFSWSSRSWIRLSPMEQRRASAASFCYKNQMIVAGGWTNNGTTDSMERMLLNQKPERWIDFSAKLQSESQGHKVAVYNHHLLVVGGCDKKGKSTNVIQEILVERPYTSKFRSRMPQPISYHGLMIL